MPRAAPQSGRRSQNPNERPSLLPAVRRLARAPATAGRAVALPKAGRAAAIALAGLLALAACGGPTATPGVSFSQGAIVVTVRNTAFDRTELFLPADRSFPLVLVNADVDSHNIAIRTQRGFEGELLFRMDPLSALSVEVVAGPFPEGTYFFICEVQPVMSGTVIVQ